MTYEGYIDFASTSEIRGWAYTKYSPNSRASIEIVCGRKVIATISADKFRGDLVAAGKGDGLHAFEFRAALPSPHEPLQARVQGKLWYLPQSGVPVETIPAPLIHESRLGCPEMDYGFGVCDPSPDEPRIVRRLIEAYHLAIRDDPYRNVRQVDVWSEITDHHHRDIIALLANRDVAGVGEYMRDAHARGITQGITQGADATHSLRTDPMARRNGACVYLDALVSLAEAVGVMDTEYPRGRVCDNLYSDPDDLLERIEKSLGVAVVHRPVIGSEFGVTTRAGIFSGRDLYAYYLAWRIRDVCAQAGIGNPSVCELGGGLGGVGYYAAKFGINRFTIIDLPLVNVLQGYFLLSSLPSTKVCLYGEEETTADVFRVLPTWMFERSEPSFDILINQDSLPEMHSHYGLGYLRQARRNVRSFLLSINHEARDLVSGTAHQSVVRDLTSQVGGYERIYRFRHWINTGYAEELYRISPEK